MSGPGIEEVNYHDFIRVVKRASDTGALIERKEKERWKEYVTENSVRDVSLEAHAKVKFSYGKPGAGGDYYGIGVGWVLCVF